MIMTKFPVSFDYDPFESN